MDDATIRKWAKHVWQQVDNTTKITRVTINSVAFESKYVWNRSPNHTVVDLRAYQFFPLDGPAVVLRLAFGREINTVFVKEDAQEGY